MEITEPKYKLGDVVAPTTHPFIEGGKSWRPIILKNKFEDVPTMVIVEVNHNPKPEHLYDEKTGKQVSSCNKYLCQWYDADLCQFKDTWLFEEQLFSSLSSDGHVLFDSIILGEVLIYRTEKTEDNKKVKDERISSKVEDYEKHSYRFMPPRLFVKGIERVENPIVYDTKRSIVIKTTSSYKIKCGWYNIKKGCFSEESLPIESLISPDISKNLVKENKRNK